MERIIVLNSKVDDVQSIHAEIPEFEKDYLQKRLDRLEGKEKIVILAFIAGKKAGYLIGYLEDEGKTLYVWLAGVHPDFRRRGVLSVLLEEARRWAAKKGCRKIRTKTRNKFKHMICFLAKNGFDFVQLFPQMDAAENELVAEKQV